MCIFKAFLFLVTLCVAKSEVDFATMCKDDFRIENNKQIDVSVYCSDKLCLQKCCGSDELMISGQRCRKTKKFFKNIVKHYPYLKSQYESVNILSSRDPNKTKNNFIFIQNRKYSDYLLNCTAEDPGLYDILEDGSYWLQDSITKKWSKIERLTYCIDYNVVVINQTISKLGVQIVIKQDIPDPNKRKAIAKFETVGLLISSFFLLLVLVVYSLLPDLRNLTGRVLMAYTFSLLVGFLSKLVLTFILKQPEPPPQNTICKNLTPLMYFGFVSSIFWLSVYAFDVWWGLRGFRMRRSSKHGDLVKFMWYCLYAWGSPLLLTAIVATLDNLPNLNLDPPPPFHDCLQSGASLDHYYKIPIGILIVINIVLFCMTVYNIWKVKHAVSKCHESGNNKQQSNKFSTYAKLCLMMGVTWFLELLPREEELWLYILVNISNLLTGVIIFYLFVCKQTILVQLCKKFNIQNDYIKYLEFKLTRNRNKSRTTRSTGLSSTARRRSKDQLQNIELSQNCPNGENNLI